MLLFQRLFFLAMASCKTYPDFVLAVPQEHLQAHLAPNTLLEQPCPNALALPHGLW